MVKQKKREGEGGKTKKEEGRMVKQKRGGEGGKTKKGGGEGGKTKKEGTGGRVVKQKKVALFLPWLRQHAALATGAQMLGWEFKWYFLSVLCWCFLAMVYAKARTYRYTGHCSNDIVTLGRVVKQKRRSGGW